MPYKINKFTGELDYFESISFSGGGSYAEVDNFAGLPSATGSGSVVLVTTTTGVWLINRKSAGFYKDTSSGVWTYIGDYPVEHASLANSGVHTHAQIDTELNQLDLGAVILPGLSNGQNQPGSILQAQIDELLLAGKYVVWFSTGDETGAIISATVTMPAISLTPELFLIIAESARNTFIDMPVVSVLPSLSVPTIEAVQGAAASMPIISIQPLLVLPDISASSDGAVGAIASMPVISVQPSLVLPPVTSVQFAITDMLTIYVQPELTLATVTTAIGTSIAMPVISVQPELTAPTVSKVRTASVSLPAVSVQPSLVAPTVTATADTTDPTLTGATFTISGLVATGATLVDPYDAVGVTGFMIRGVSTKPSASATGNQTDSVGVSNGWKTTSFTDCTFTSTEAHPSPGISLYVFAKDAAGNVSTGAEVTGNVFTAGGGTGYTDNFNRASLGADWGTPTGGATGKIAGSATYGTDAPGLYSNYRDAVFADNQYSIIQLITPANDSSYGGPAVRMQTGNRACYMAQLVDDGGVYIELIEISTTGILTQLGFGDPGTDTWVKITANGTSIKVYTSPNGSTGWMERISVTDASLTAGKAGVVVTNGYWQCDSWSGGDL